MTTNRQAILINRVLEREVSRDELAELASLAATDPAVWGELAAALGAQCIVQRGVDAARQIAASVELPLGSCSPAVAAAASRRRLRSWSGWLTAAVIALAFVVVQLVNLRGQQPQPFAGGPDQQDEMRAEDPFDQYLLAATKAGRVVRPLPPVTVDVRPDSEGRGTEVIYLRRVLERTTVDEVFTLGQDEHGRAIAVRSSTPPRGFGKTL